MLVMAGCPISRAVPQRPSPFMPHFRLRIVGAWSVGLAILPLLVSSCSAPGRSSPSQVSMHARMNEAFLAKAPRVGEPLPDAEGFDAQGKPFTLAETRGRVTVIVAGCIT